MEREEKMHEAVTCLVAFYFDVAAHKTGSLEEKRKKGLSLV